MIRGLIAPLLVPFNDDLSFDQSLYNSSAIELLENGFMVWHRLAQLERRYQSAIMNAKWRLKAWWRLALTHQ